MAPLLITVAILQYQWARQLSASTEARIDTNLEALMTRWLVDLNDQLSAPCIALQVGPDAGERDNWSDYLDRYINWRQASDGQNRHTPNSSPQLVRDVYIWESSDRVPRLWRFKLSPAKIESSSQLDDLSPLLKRLQAKSASLPIAANAWKLDGSPTQEENSNASSLARRFRAMSGWQFDPEMRAFVHPILHHQTPLDSRTPINRSAVDWIIVVLDNAAIRNRLLPELAMRNFGGPNGLQYELVVTTNAQNPTVLYASGPFSLSDLPKFRATINVFDSGTSDSRQPSSANPESPNVRDATWRYVHASISFPVMQSSSEYQGWVLGLQPKDDSGNALANGFWRRDLIVGGLLLLLLVANMILVIFATQRADRFARLQMEFIASVSHELRTPLAAIMSAGENLKDGFIPSQNSLAFYGSLITNKSRQLIQLVDRILLFGSTLSGKTQYVVRPLAVADIFQTVRKETAGLLEGLGFTVDQHVETGLPLVVGDLSGIVSCLQNFITNATKYGGKDKWIGLFAKRQTTGKGEEIQISVADHGPGIAESDLSHIFEPFYRSPSAISSQIPGTGLGLAVAKNIAEALGGRISVQTAIGVGTTFVLHLPVITQAPHPLAVNVSDQHE